MMVRITLTALAVFLVAAIEVPALLRAGSRRAIWAVAGILAAALALGEVMAVTRSMVSVARAVVELVRPLGSVMMGPPQ